MIADDDRGFTFGVGLFETILVIDGEPVAWDAHLDRLARGCVRLTLPPPDRAECASAATDALQKAGLRQGRAALRLTWTGGSGQRGLTRPDTPSPLLIVTASTAPKPPAAILLATVSIRRNASSVTSRYKTLSYLDNVLARQEALAAGADEALLLDTDGNLSGAAAANLFWFEGETLCTPTLDCGVLDGIVRAEVLHAAGRLAREVTATPSALTRSDGAFLTNSLIGRVSVRSIDGFELPFRKTLLF